MVFMNKEQLWSEVCRFYIGKFGKEKLPSNGLDLVERKWDKESPYEACSWGRGLEIRGVGKTLDEAMENLSKKLTDYKG